jgi:hypothetical protein
MKQRHKALFFTIVPSPYQRDRFGALAAREEVDLSVCYMEAASPDSLWPERPLRPLERIMPGFWIPFGSARGHVNWGLPDLSESHVVVLSSFTSLTGQWLMRGGLRRKRWLFWGERFHPNSGMKKLIQCGLASPISHASGIVAIGRAAQDDYRQRFPNLPNFCIPYHCDLSPFFAIRRRSEGGAPVTFFFCGQMIRRKGVDLLLLAFERLIASGVDARLLLVGREADLPYMHPSACGPPVVVENFAREPSHLGTCRLRRDAFPDGQSALNRAAARLRHIAGTAWSSKRYLNIELLKDRRTSR